MENKKPHIVYLGEWGFPIGFAAIQKQLLVSKGLLAHGCKVTVISFKGSHSKSVDLPPTGTFEGVNYIYTSGSVHRPKGFVDKMRQKLKGRIQELLYLRKLKRANDLAVCLIATRNFYLLTLYWLWLKMLKVPMAMWSVELNSARASRDHGLKNRLNDYLYENLGYKMVDGVMAISNYLVNHSKQYAPQTPVLKSPIITNFDEFAIDDVQTSTPVSFVYCGSPNYFQIVDFVLKAFEMVELNAQEVYLDFILGGGKPEEMEVIKNAIAANKYASNIRIHRNITREEVAMLYAQASGLLIPLRETVQDEARFPHKLGEYLASASPVITNAVGEINNYDFIDGETALVAARFDPAQFATKLEFILQNPEKAKAIGIAGRNMGYQNFDYVKLGGEVKEFVLNL